MNAENTLKHVIDLLITNLQELKEVRDEAPVQFQYGEKTAFVECLEAIRLWDGAEHYGINFDIEKQFTL